MKELTKIQQRLLDFISKRLTKGRPFPSLREIGDNFSFTRNTARFHLLALERKGLVQRRDQRVSDYFLVGLGGSFSRNSFDLVSTISAGMPVETYERQGESVTFDHYFFGGGDLKAVTISGDSMTGDAISHGDTAIIKLQSEANPKDILAVRIDGHEITLKRIRQRQDQIELIPSNPDYSIRKVPAESVNIIGKLVGVIRIA